MYSIGRIYEITFVSFGYQPEKSFAQKKFETKQAPENVLVMKEVTCDS